MHWGSGLSYMDTASEGKSRKDSLTADSPRMQKHAEKTRWIITRNGTRGIAYYIDKSYKSKHIFLLLFGKDCEESGESPRILRQKAENEGKPCICLFFSL